MKYNVGDRVKIRTDLVVDEIYGNLHMCDDMKEELCEKCVTVQEYTKDNNYIIKESCYIISDEMIEGLVDELDNEEIKINEEQLTVYDIDFTKLKHGDAIYITNKEEYDYCINELNNLGYVWQYRNGLNTFTAYTGDNPILLMIKINKTVSYMNILTNNYNDCGELNILNKIINESNKSILDKVNFNNLKENDAIICGNKENYDYVVDKLYELGYKFYNNKSDGYEWFRDDVVIYISCENILKFSEIDYLYNNYEEEYGFKLSDITIIDLREKNIEKSEQINNVNNLKINKEFDFEKWKDEGLYVIVNNKEEAINFLSKLWNYFGIAREHRDNICGYIDKFDLCRNLIYYDEQEKDKWLRIGDYAHIFNDIINNKKDKVVNWSDYMDKENTTEILKDTLGKSSVERVLDLNVYNKIDNSQQDIKQAFVDIDTSVLYKTRELFDTIRDEKDIEKIRNILNIIDRLVITKNKVLNDFDSYMIDELNKE